MSLYMPILDYIERRIADWEWSNFYSSLNEYEKEGLKRLIVKEGKKVELEYKKQALEELQKDIDGLEDNMNEEEKKAIDGDMRNNHYKNLEITKI